MTAERLKNICVSAVMAAVLIVCSQIYFPLPSAVAITLQTAAVAFCGYYLGAKRAVCAVGAYIFLGLLGVPVFSGASGGPAVLFGASGGFIIGFLPLCLFCAAFKGKKNFGLSFVMGLIGLTVCHILGIIMFSFVTKTPLVTSLITVSLPYIIKDVLSVFAALWLSRRILVI